ncbi:MAG: hypothetical protein IJL32_13240 [Oscillospiraceae bacterium]|nr:hypothetical protein [Oscillospiraceae bacterium]
MNSMKKLTAVLLAAMVTLPAFACGQKIENSGNDQSVADLNTGNQEGDPTSEDAAPDNPGQADVNPDGYVEESKEEASLVDQNVVIDENGQRNQKLTFSSDFNDNTPVVAPFRGQDGQYYVPKTDINGKTAVDNNGQTQTEVYKDPGKRDYPLNYTPEIRSYQAFWLDISQRKDYVFDGNLLEFEVKIADDAPDGVYPVEVYHADFSNYDAVSIKDAVMNTGYICINKTQPAEEKKGTKFALTPETVSAAPGDTVRMNLKIDNNPGIVAFVIRMHYDSKIMSIVDAAAGEELGDLAQLTTNTLDDD